jgi:hypothetical protein
VELATEPVEGDPRILLAVHPPGLVGLRLHRGREELSQAREHDPDDREHDEHLDEREAVLRFRRSPETCPSARLRDTCCDRRALGHQAMRRLSTRSACPS